MTPELAKLTLEFLKRSKLEGNLPQQMQEAQAASKMLAALEEEANPSPPPSASVPELLPDA